MTPVLIITNEQDVAADLVVLEFRRRDIQVLRCNTEAIRDWRISCSPGISWTMEDGLGRTANSRTVTGVWWRRPEPPIPPAPFDSTEEKRAFAAQWQALLEGLASVPGPRWISPPAAIRVAEDKAAQLSLARRIGFKVPSTVWTNEIRSVEPMTQTVVKPVTTAAWSDDHGPAFVFARLVDESGLPGGEELAAMPAAFQLPIWPKQDVRITVVGDRVMAAIACDTPGDGLDWRLTPDRDWRPHALSEESCDRCKALVHEFGLCFGAIDLVRDEAGELWFLEVNPNGEWGWLSQLAGLPIVNALCDELSREPPSDVC